MNNLIPFESKMKWISTPNNLAASAAVPANLGNAASQNSLGATAYGDVDNDPADINTPNVEDMSIAQQMAAIGQLDTMQFAMPTPISLTMQATKAAIEHNLENDISDLGLDYGGAVGPGTGIGAADVAAGAENASMGLDAGAAAAASMGLGVNDNGNNSEAAGPGATGSSVDDGSMSFSGSPAASEHSTGEQAGNSTGGSDGAGAKVICTELRGQGFIPDDIWEADQAYAITVNSEVRAGYLMWGVPWVRVMRRSRLATQFTRLFAEPWAQHMAYEMGVVKKDSFLGRLSTHLVKLYVALFGGVKDS